MVPASSGEGGEAPPSRWDLAEGEEIAPGRVALRSLGTGNLYETYLAWDDRLYSIVVAKLVRRDKVEDPDALRALRAEADALQRLAHPMLVRSFGSVLEGDRPHLILEHLEGPPLHTLIRKYAPLPLEQILPLAVDLCSVLHYFETEGVVHLDVKPGNVIMSASPKLVDLSLVRTIVDARRIIGEVGTEGYMAPEQLTSGSKEDIGPATDIWGLGVTVYEALAGRLPFPDPEEGGPTDGSSEPAPLPQGVPVEVAEALKRCLDPDPSKRPRAAHLALELSPVVEALSGRRVIRRGRPRLR